MQQRLYGARFIRSGASRNGGGAAVSVIGTAVEALRELDSPSSGLR